MATLNQKVEELFLEFRKMSECFVEDAAEFIEGRLPLQIDAHISKTHEIVEEFRDLGRQLNLLAPESIEMLKEALVLRATFVQIRSRLLSGQPPELCRLVEEIFVKLYADDESSAMLGIDALVTLSLRHAELAEDEFDLLSEQVSTSFGSRISRAAGRGVISIPEISVKVEHEDSSQNDDSSLELDSSLPASNQREVSLLALATPELVAPESLVAEAESLDDEIGYTKDSKHTVKLGLDYASLSNHESEREVSLISDTTTTADEALPSTVSEVEDDSDPVVEKIEIPAPPLTLFADFVTAVRAEPLVDATDLKVQIDDGIRTTHNLEASMAASAWQRVINNLGTRPCLSFNLALALEDYVQGNARSVVPSWILRVSILSKFLEFPNQELERHLREHFDSHTLDELDDQGDSLVPERARALSLILAGALLRPLLIAPDCGARAMMQDLRHIGGSVHELLVHVASAADRLRAVNISTIRQLLFEKRREVGTADLQNEAKSWVSGIQTSHLTFAEARKIRRLWLMAGGILQLLIQPVIDNDASAASNLSILVEKIDENFIDRKIFEADSRTNQNRIEGNARRQLHATIEVAADIARRWLAINDLAPEQQTYAASEFAKLEGQCENLLPKIKAELLDMQRSATPIMASAIASFQDSIDNFLSVFQSLARESEEAATVLQHGDLLSTPVTLSSERVTDSEVLDFRELVDALSSPPFSLQDAFEFRLSKGSYEAASIIASMLEVHDNDQGRRLQDELRSSLAARRRSVKAETISVRSLLERAFTQHVIKDEERNEMDSGITQILGDLANPTTFTFIHLEHQLEGLRVKLSLATNAVTREIRSECSKRDLPEGAVASIERCLEAGLLNVAYEYLTNPSASRRNDATSLRAIERLNSFKNYLDGFASENDSPLSLREAEEAIRVRASWGPLSFEELSPSMAELSKSALRTWHEASLTLGDIKEGQLGGILRSIGLPVTSMRVLTKTPYPAPARGFDVDLHVAGDRETIPVPSYGSQSSGFYRFVVLWDRLSESRLRKILIDEKDQRPIVVIYFGRVQIGQRLELARLARRSFGEQQFLLLDENLFLFLLSLSEERSRAFFELALAFSTNQPYSSTSGSVPREMFFGRSREMQQLMERNGPNLLYGGRQLGKTALLRQIQATSDSLEDGRVVRYIDLHDSGVGLHRPTSEIFGTIAKRLKDIGFKEGRNTGEREVLSFIQKWIEGDERRRVVLLLDESDDFLKQDSFERFKISKKLKALMDNTDRRFKIVFAGLHNVLRTTVQENHPLAHLGQPVNIGPLMSNGEEEDALRLIREPLASLGFEMPVDIAFNILAQTNYYPSLLQIYGKYLVEILYQEGQRHISVPTGVTQQIVDDAYYFKPDLAETIRRNFRLTLQLDQRYEFVAYAMALSYLEKELDLQKGFDFEAIRQKGVAWWPIAFEKMSFDELSALLDEMVGLGVLRKIENERYTFRTPNVLQLMGSNAQIEEMVTKTRELEIQFDPAAFREKFQGRDEWSPLTDLQKRIFTSRDHRVLVVTGSRALGLTEVRKTLATIDTANVIDAPSCNDITAFRVALSRFVESINNAEGFHFLLVSQAMLWDATWIVEALDRVGRRKSQNIFVKIVFLADSIRVRDLVTTTMWKRVIDLRPQLVSLERWRDTAVRQMIVDLGLESDRLAREKLENITGYMPSLLKAFAQRRPSSTRQVDLSTAALFSNSSWPESYLEDAGIPSSSEPLMHEFLSCLALTDRGSKETAIDGMTSHLSENLADQYLQCFQILELIASEGDRHTVYPDVKAAIGL